MKKDYQTAAVQIADVEAVYQLWRRTHTGGKSAFYDFMTEPSFERDEFVNGMRSTIELHGHTIAKTITV